MSTHCNCPHLLSWHGTAGCTWTDCGCRFGRWFSATGANGDAPSDAEAPSPLSEDGADSAIAIHSTGSGPDALEGRRRGSLSTPKGATEAPAISAAAADGNAQQVDTAESRQTPQGPPVEAGGAARPSYLSGVAVHELRLMHALAVARLSLLDDPATFIEAACAVADLFPVMECLGCGKTFVPVYRRQTKFCSDRCRYRIGMRNRRRRLAAEAMSDVTALRDGAE